MSISSAFHMIAVGFFYGISFYGISAARETTPPTLETLRSGVDASVGSVETMYVSFVVSTKKTMKDMAMADLSFRIQQVCEYATDGRRHFRAMSVTQSDGQLIEAEIRYDGEKSGTVSNVFRPNEKRERNEPVSITRKFDDINLFQNNLYITSVGSFHYDGPWLEVWKFLPRPPLPPRAFSVVKIFDEQQNYRVLPNAERVGGHMCWVIEYDGFDKLWLAPELGYAVVKREWSMDHKENRALHYENSGFNRVTSQAWLPTQSSRRLVDTLNDGRVLVEAVLKVTKLTVNEPHDDLLTLNYPVNTRIIDATVHPDSDGTGPFVEYYVGDSAEETEKRISFALSDSGVNRHFDEIRKTRRQWQAFFVGCCVLVTVTVFAIVRSRQK